jgi:hypothetical protein
MWISSEKSENVMPNNAKQFGVYAAVSVRRTEFLRIIWSF